MYFFNKNCNYLKYLFLFLFFIFLSGASDIAANEILFIIFNLILFSYSFLLSQNYNWKATLFLLVFLMVTLSVYYFKNGRINIWTFGGFFLRIINAFLIVRIFKGLYIENIVRIVVGLTFISLLGYIFQLLIPDYFFEVNDLFGLDEGVKVISSSLFFNMNLLIHPNRNCGFMWEPGAFAGVLTAILYLNNNTSVENRKANNIILIIGILTTLSTMGYLTLLVHLFSKVKFKNRVVTASFLIFSIVAIYYLSDEVPFLKEKIIDQIVNLDSELERVTLANKGGYSAGLTRFGSILIDWDVFINNPFIGLGPDIYTTNQDLIYGEFGENVIRASGLMNFLLKFGLVGVLLFFYLQYKSFPSSEKKVKVFWILLIGFVLFSNPFDTSPFLFSFLFIDKFQIMKS
jgi:hypothetical protein